MKEYKTLCGYVDTIDGALNKMVAEEGWDVHSMSALEGYRVAFLLVREKDDFER